MMGNYHVRFRGGGRPATASCYPASRRRPRSWFLEVHRRSARPPLLSLAFGGGHLMSRRRAMLIVGLTASVLIGVGAWLLLPRRTGPEVIDVSGATRTKLQESCQRVDWLVTPVSVPVKVEVNDDRKQL